MGGKASLILVLGFSLIFLIFGFNYGTMTTNATDNVVEYAEVHMAYYNAQSAANMVLSQWREALENNTTYNPPSEIDFGNYGKATISLNTDHYSAGNTSIESFYTLTINGTFQGEESEVEIKFNQGNFARFAYFSDNEGGNIWWTNNSIVNGPFHTNDDLRCYRNPVFNGKTTTYGGNVVLWDPSNPAQHSPIVAGDFYKDYKEMNFEAVSKYEAQAIGGGHYFSGHDKVYITFAGDYIKYKFSATGTETTVAATTFAPNGVIYIKDGEVHIKGVVKGRYSVVAAGNVTMNTDYNVFGSVDKYGNITNKYTGKGNIFIDGDITYNDNIDWDGDPSSSQDLLGIVAEQNVLVAQNSVNENNGVEIDGAIYCQKGGFGVENYKNFNPGQDIRLRGGLTQNIRRTVGTFNSSTGNPSSGLTKDYQYDKRLEFMNPPSYPSSPDLRIYSWLE